MPNTIDATEFAPISLAAAAALARQQATDFEIFLPSPTEHVPVLYRRGGAAVSLPDFERIGEHGIQTLYVRSDDLHRCERSIEDRLDAILASQHVSPADKAEIVHSAGRSVARDLVTSSTTVQNLERTSRIIDTMIHCVLNDPATSASLLQMARYERATASHMFLVATLGVALGAEAFGEDHEFLKEVGLAGMLHDLGKLSIPLEILNKPTKLTREEMQIVQHHPIESVRLIGDESHVTPAVRQMILQHHERIDGRGYPIGLTDGDLLDGSRVLTIVDSFHALIGRRTYRAALSIEEANRVLISQKGKQFDEALLNCWTDLCQRSDDNTPTRCTSVLGPTSDELSTRHEHRPLQPTPAVLGQRRPRFDCKNPAMVQCVYVGRLTEATRAPREFSAMVQDVSRGGLCLSAAYPMYRGEVLHVRIRMGSSQAWVRCTVAWCRQQSENIYKVGLRFTERIEASEALESVEPKSAIDMDSGSTPIHAKAGVGGDSTSKGRMKRKSVEHGGNHRQAIRTLTAISTMSTIPRDQQQVVITLATSGEAKIRVKAMNVLAQIKSRLTRSAIAALLDDTNPSIRDHALRLIGSHKIHEASGTLKGLLQSSDRRLALRAAGALGLLGDKVGLPLVSRVLENDASESRLAARTLGDITGHRFPANYDGVRAARRYLDATKLVSGKKGKRGKSRSVVS
ncbi:MAG: HD domain-containing protein [Planctomycetes bacterium]|nr:HD domain-containing protein [Planctomycetota bacterium]